MEKQSRNPKFRLWDDLNKKWLLGYELDNLGGFSMFGEVMLFGEYINAIQDIKQWDNLKLMQFTGLKDKNGRECYEGDIIKVHEYKNVEFSGMSIEEREIFTVDELKGELRQTYIAEVRWAFCGFEVSESETCDAGFGIFEGDQRYSSTIHVFEIIGNIYEHKELLNGK